MRGLSAALLLPSMLVAAGQDPDWHNVTVYRTTPSNYTGLTNMDSGDARGDVYFGLAQLLLPQLCVADPGFLWCQNRKFLSGGKAHMVYTEFVVQTRSGAFGDYAACNPDQKTGVFGCEGQGGGQSGPSPPPPPPQCNADGNSAYHNDCFNGTVYRTLAAGEGACCAACSSDGEKCRGWSMPARNGTTCRLLAEPLINWDDAMHSQGCAAGEHRTGGGGGGGGWSDPCWYDDPEYNSSAVFQASCSKANCSCNAIETLSMGREQSAMCWHHRHSPPPPPPLPLHQMPIGAAVGLAEGDGRSDNLGPLWTCSGAVYNLCYGLDGANCAACATKNVAALAAAGCTTELASQICHSNNVTCPAAVKAACPGLVSGRPETTRACQQCASRHSASLQAANCSAALVNGVCYVDDDDNDNPWSDYIDQLACTMNGTWYSTQMAGQCKGETEEERAQEVAAGGCWWRVAETKRTVDQSCVDNRVVQAVKTKRGQGCWQRCHGKDAGNITSACWLHCFFDTMLGTNLTKPLTADEIAAPFIGAFLPVAEGGCPPPAMHGEEDELEGGGGRWWVERSTRA